MTRNPLERIAVTGLGMVTSFGPGADLNFGRLASGACGILLASDDFGLTLNASPVAEVPSRAFAGLSSVAGVASWSRCDRLAYVAATEAIERAGFGRASVQLLLGETTGASREAVLDYAEVEPTDAGPLIRRLVREPLGVTGDRLRQALPQIASSAVVCSACSSGALAVALGAMRLEHGARLPQLVGGVDALSALTLVGFGSLGALSSEPCRPFDARRKGLNLGEGAGFLVLETESMVHARNASVLAWLDGYAVGAEAHHLTHPEPDGERASALLLEAMRRASLTPADIGYINAHGTATLPNDAMETKAIARALGSAIGSVRVSSSKGQLGHTLGAAGAIEAAIVAMSLQSQRVVPTVGLCDVDPECALNHVVGTAQSLSFSAALSSSFGFGGSGAVLALTAASRQRLKENEPKRALRSRLFVTNVITLGSAGLLRGVENAALGEAVVAPPIPRLPLEPLDALVMERSRRFDRLTAMTALCAASLLDTTDAEPAATGLIVGNALGDVSRSVEFLKRVRGRGPKGAHPAEFPHLLPSSVSGNASIYAHLKGPAFNVSEFGETAEIALELAANCVLSGCANAMISGTVEALDEQVLSVLTECGALRPSTVPFTEGAAFLLLESEPARRPRGSTHCELAWFGCAQDVGVEVTEAVHSARRCEVLWAGDSGASLGGLDALGWVGVPQRSVSSQVGRGWHLSAFLHAVASARVLAGEADAILVVTEPPQGRHLALFVAA